LPLSMMVIVPSLLYSFCGSSVIWCGRLSMSIITAVALVMSGT
jgi:hypothetical protein